MIVASYEEAIQKSPSAKILIFTNCVDQLMEDAEKELPKDMFHMIRGSPFPFFVEFLLPGINILFLYSQFMDLYIPLFITHMLCFKSILIRWSGINKGSALKLLCEHLNISIAESVAFGGESYP